MKTAHFLDHMGGMKAAARFLDVHPSSIYAWGKIVPKGRAFEIYVRTEFKVPLNPQDYDQQKGYKRNERD